MLFIITLNSVTEAIYNPEDPVYVDLEEYHQHELYIVGHLEKDR